VWGEAIVDGSEAGDQRCDVSVERGAKEEGKGKVEG
jgi:hypothetical protein